MYKPTWTRYKIVTVLVPFFVDKSPLYSAVHRLHTRQVATVPIFLSASATFEALKNFIPRTQEKLQTRNLARARSAMPILVNNRAHDERDMCTHTESNVGWRSDKNVAAVATRGRNACESLTQ